MLARRFVVSTVAVITLAVPCVGIRADSLTTLYNPTSHERGNMFDVTTFDNPVRITSLDIHTQDTAGNRTLRVYTRPGTYVGHESNSEGWTLHSLVPGITGMGHNTPTPIDIHDLYLPAGTATGLYVTFESGNLGYTNPGNAPGTLTTYGGPASNLQLDLGAGIGFPFGDVYSPRIWNGTVHYDVLDAIPDPQPQIFIHGGNGVVFGPDSKWNTIHADLAGVPVAMHDAAGVPAGVTATLSSGWSNSATIGQAGEYVNTHPVLAEATDDYMFVTTGNTSRTLTLEGLADTWYRVEMSASRNFSGSVWQNTTLNGAWADGDHTGQGFSAKNHGYQQGTVLLWRARPTDGTLTLEVSRQDLNAYLNALIVTQLPEPQPKIYIDAGNVNVFSAYDKWNTIHAGLTGPIALYDPDGVPTGATVTIGGSWTNLTDTTNQTGAIASTHAILAEASNDSIWIGDVSAAMEGTLTFEGLPEPESWQWYRFEMSASRSQQALPRWQDVTINGLWADGDDHTGERFNAYTDGFLAGKVLTWDSVVPDENGLVTLTFSTGSNEFAYLNAMVITLVPEPSTALLLALGGLSLTFRRRRRKPHSISEILHGVHGNAARSSKAPRHAEYEPRSVAMLPRVLHVAVVGAVALVLCTTHASAATYTLSTLWNTGTTPRAGGNMFDVTTFDAPVRVSGLDINTASTAGSKTLRVYTRPETYQGHESSSAGWTLHSVIPAITGLGPGKHTHVDIHDLYLPAETTTGLYVTLETMPSAIDGSLVYSNLGDSTTYGGPASNLQLDLGAGIGFPFGDVYSPRIWNGTVHYDVLDAMPDPQPQIFIDGGNGVVFGPDSKWNTIHAGLAGVPVAMHDSAGVPTGVTATLGSRWTNSGTIGQAGKYANTHPVLAEATDDYMYVTGIGNTGTLTLEGLADTWYRVEMSASRNLSNVQQNTTLNGAWADGDHNGQGFNARTDGFDKGTVLLWRARPTDGVLTLEVSRTGPDAYLNALIVTQLPSEPQPQIFIDAGNAVVPGGKWNTIHAGMTGTPIALYDPVGVPTGATATIVGNWTNSTVTGQAGEYANTHPILAEATDDFMWLGTSPTSVTLTLDGLMPESWQWYRVEMSASRSSGTYTRRQDVTLNGLWADGPDHNGQDFDATNDGYLAGKVLSWDHVRPDEHGLITLTITRGLADGYLNALVITLVPEPSTALLLALGGLSLTLRRRRRKPRGI